jgi:hypothetical protein
MDPTRKLTDPLEKIGVARKMYLAGFALLPWLWMVNYLLFRKDIIRPTAPHELKVCTSLLAKPLSEGLIYVYIGEIRP